MRRIPSLQEMNRRVTVGRHREGSVIDVWVVPGAARTEVVGPHDGALRVRVAVPAEDGKANAAVAVVLKDRFTAQEAYLESGARSRRKRYVLVGVSPDEVAALLGG